MTNITELEKQKCCGCGSCVQSCPKNCITLKEDEEGFLYPQIDKTSCINCSLCIKKCPAINYFEKSEFSQEFYGAKLKNKEELKQSASGGMFAGFADYILENNGIVYGCAVNENLKPFHKKAENKEELIALKGSKYVQSDTKKTYSEVKELLNNGNVVLYSGTPCQIAGLNSYLGKNYENLYTVDLVCHGVPSFKLFSKYITWLEKKNKASINYYGFRDKDVRNWGCDGKILYGKKKKKILASFDPFYSAFLRGEIYRPSCYQCKYANINNRPADITIGDFWGIELSHPKFYSKDGVSCCIINTEQGKKLFEKSKNLFDVISVKKDEITRKNINLIRATKITEKRNCIYKDMNILPLEQFIKKLGLSKKNKIKRILISCIPQNFKLILKRIIGKIK